MRLKALEALSIHKSGFCCQLKIEHYLGTPCCAMIHRKSDGGSLSLITWQKIVFVKSVPEPTKNSVQLTLEKSLCCTISAFVSVDSQGEMKLLYVHLPSHPSMDEGYLVSNTVTKKNMSKNHCWHSK